jgi:hypothetical protein
MADCYARLKPEKCEPPGLLQSNSWVHSPPKSDFAFRRFQLCLLDARGRERRVRCPAQARIASLSVSDPNHINSFMNFRVAGYSGVL